MCHWQSAHAVGHNPLLKICLLCLRVPPAPAFCTLCFLFASGQLLLCGASPDRAKCYAGHSRRSRLRSNQATAATAVSLHQQHGRGNRSRLLHRICHSRPLRIPIIHLCCGWQEYSAVSGSRREHGSERVEPQRTVRGGKSRSKIRKRRHDVASGADWVRVRHKVEGSEGTSSAVRCHSGACGKLKNICCVWRSKRGVLLHPVPAA